MMMTRKARISSSRKEKGQNTAAANISEMLNDKKNAIFFIN
jgi:hypothetical protein